ncbi:MAG: hypothetical protein ISN29_10725 [Gammaproteobacteria bacterium AqS3]|nr:hypothetical protein [Gammaproteobacteria bacterium AqS3]
MDKEKFVAVCFASRAALCRSEAAPMAGRLHRSDEVLEGSLGRRLCAGPAEIDGELDFFFFPVGIAVAVDEGELAAGGPHAEAAEAAAGTRFKLPDEGMNLFLGRLMGESGRFLRGAGACFCHK